MAAYNAHPDSVTNMTACLTPEEFDALVSKNLAFNKIVIVNGQGSDVMSKIGQADNWDDEFMPKVETFKFNGSIQNAISAVHALIEEDPMEYGMG